MPVTGTYTGVLTFDAANEVATGPFVMVSCRWVGATTAGDKCVVVDLKGNEVFRGEANGANYTDGWAFDRKWVDGLEIASLNSGVLNVYLSTK